MGAVFWLERLGQGGRAVADRYILLVHGPNLNRLGVRKPEVYGQRTLADVVELVRSTALPFGFDVIDRQSNHEGDLIDFLQQYGPGAHGIIINPGAFGHYSYALRDCLEDIDRPTVEVHISNVHRREPFRHQLVLSDVVTGQIVGLGLEGYRLATLALCQPKP
ncbi:3-dehydroquinate dehydratase, type II [Alicyclobacillus acidocaldarius subsp. acidocaldarius Tc-4-1]|uniref:3-dehydroquinate dehydratase n=1 Tax=Alicyclobacillus acidocaldarius (strain Tc-4-1) TaxID=1048834 RepID=F8IL58_ALIAT|nr:3-dehydroquinate dehydratase, type II [Alicyclobacillus acidocaldarius subsp. acidocaldarius Tc-4-1]